VDTERPLHSQAVVGCDDSKRPRRDDREVYLHPVLKVASGAYAAP
jgi:hypothetical protein